MKIPCQHRLTTIIALLGSALGSQAFAGAIVEETAISLNRAGLLGSRAGPAGRA
jgi:hypothetical protein